ncbi:MAG: GNA1162 family protein [Burkholderiaceae bacterium]
MTSQTGFFSSRVLLSAMAAAALLTTGCATAPAKDNTPSLMSQYKPRSILILPPIDNTIEVDASYKYLPTVTRPVAERGYYVFPVAVVDRLMRENGLPGPAEMHAVSRDRLRDVFGADAVLYLSLSKWGSSYSVLDSSTRVTVSGRLVDLKTGTELWQGQGTAADSSSSSNQGGLAGLLVGALIRQIASSVSDNSPQVARAANASLFGRGVGTAKGALPAGPYRVAFDEALKAKKAGGVKPAPAKQ